jgi:hypothetical protein
MPTPMDNLAHLSVDRAAGPGPNAEPGPFA